MVKFKSHGKCSTDITRWSISLAIYDVGRSSKMSYFHGHGPLGSKKEFEGCYVQQFWSRNQGQPACFPKKSKLHELDDVWDESKPLLGGEWTSCYQLFSYRTRVLTHCRAMFDPLYPRVRSCQELSPVLRKEKILPQVGRPRWVAPLAPLDGKYKVQIRFGIGLGTWTQCWKNGIRIERWGCKICK